MSQILLLIFTWNEEYLTLNCLSVQFRSAVGTGTDSCVRFIIFSLSALPFAYKVFKVIIVMFPRDFFLSSLPHVQCFRGQLGKL